MIKFLGQVINGQIRSDMVLELTNAVEYQQWAGNDMIIEYCSYDDILSGEIFNIIDTDEITEFIPVGTLEFVYAFIDKIIKENGSASLRPMNIPNSLIKYAGRYIGNCTLTSDNRNTFYEFLYSVIYGPDMFIKSNKKIKFENNGKHLIKDILDEHKFPNGNYQISNIIADSILSEYRCFIYKGELKGIQYYSGDYTKFPNIDTINNIIYDINHSLDFINNIAYTVDVAVLDNDTTILMECHEFYSCGLYGFNDYTVLPYMYSRTFNYIKKIV